MCRGNMGDTCNAMLWCCDMMYMCSSSRCVCCSLYSHVSPPRPALIIPIIMSHSSSTTGSPLSTSSRLSSPSGRAALSWFPSPVTSTGTSREWSRTETPHGNGVRWDDMSCHVMLCHVITSCHHVMSYRVMSMSMSCHRHDVLPSDAADVSCCDR